MTVATRQRRVVISGLGFITSIGNDKAAVSRSLRELRTGIERHDFFPGNEVGVKVAGTIKEFDTRSDHHSAWRWPARYQLTREMLRSLPPHGVYAACAMQQLVEDAKLTAADLANDQTGLFTASAGSPFLQRTFLNSMYETKGERMFPMGVVSTIAGTLSFNLATHYGVRGAVCGYVSACASSAHAIGYAFDEITLGRLDRVVIVGGEDLTPDSIYSFHAMRVLSRSGDPATASRPFDAARDGFVGTGGAAALLLETPEAAQARGAPIYGEVLGWGQSADGFNLATSDPDGRGLTLAIERALKSAGVAPAEVDYVNAHATATPAGDRSEARALQRVFTARGATPAVSSLKALTGHGLSMAAAMETGFCALALAEGFTPGQAHLTNPDPDAVGLNLPRATTEQAPRTILKNSSGFGGSNVVLVLRAFRSALPPVSP